MAYTPNRPIRRSQLISPYGTGAMIDFPGRESLMVAGLDAWDYPKEEKDLDEFIIEEKRLQHRLRVAQFRLPLDFREPGDRNFYKTIPTVRFPEWHFCERCGTMKKVSMFGSRKKCLGIKYRKRTCAGRKEAERPYLVPERFVAACEAGHIRDFPWMKWIHRDKPIADSCKLRRGTGRSASLAGLVIRCSCEGNPRRSMAEALGEGALGIKCGGQRPWLGDTKHEKERCGRILKVIQKGSSNVFFPTVVSSIYLPLWAENASQDVIAVLEDTTNWDIITESGKLNEDACRIIARSKRVNPEYLIEFARKKYRGENLLGDRDSEEDFRRDEYIALSKARGSENSELSTRKIEAQDYETPFGEFFSGVALVDQLRETRAFAGFSRIIPDNKLSKSSFDQLKLSKQINWLPAIKNYGEGIFFTLNEKEVNEWTSLSAVTERINKLKKNYPESKMEGKPEDDISPKFVLLHTLAHLLIAQLSFDCGYGSSSLRERIYCNIESPSKPMTGFLIYTASGDSEGSMGGLVRQGERGNLEKILTRALNKALWCSSDPVCVESKGQGPRNCNLAACHSCALLPETSCEKGNKLLDRVAIVGTPQDKELGFFGNFLDWTK